MSPAELLALLTSAGVALYAEAGRLRYRAPAGTYTPELRGLVDEHRAALLAHLEGNPSWDQASADAVLAEADALLVRALQPGGAADTPPRQRVVGHYRRALQAVHARRDPIIFEAPCAVRKLLARWQGPGTATAEPPSVASQTAPWFFEERRWSTFTSSGMLPLGKYPWVGGVKAARR